MIPICSGYPRVPMLPTPIPQSYWVVPGQLLAGEYPRDKDENTSQQKIHQLLASGVAAVIDLTAADDGLLPYAQWLGTATHHSFPIPDVSVPASASTTIAILDTIDHYLAQRQIVYVHCWGGVGRTGVIIGCWLARHGFEGEAALERLRYLWQQCPKSQHRRSPETSEQERYICQWPAAGRADTQSSDPER
jgi:protein-tyrosine phosphatase